MSPRTPALFIGHGAPMNAIEDNSWTRGWQEIAAELPRPKAIVCVSAHWETRGLAVTADPWPRTIHDFGGFPQALFDVQYPAPGDPALARRAAELLGPAPVRQADDWGLDHGAWSVLIRMYPKADIPVVQLSLDRALTGPEHYEVGARLAPLRDEGVMVIGSGNIVHNLRAADFRRPEAPGWAARFNDEARRLILAGDHRALADYDGLGQDAALAINSAEHYLPLLYVLALGTPGEATRIFNDQVFAAISMLSLVVG